ncbi:MAG TPA: glycoside hydrolase family 15 protein [Streptosporangiaceae bacterium]|nr:glycoside hydrolase family 15 protein [Streptosporangiaceae bacterium]
MTDTPIADYALLSDCHTAALVSRDGSVDWLCFPRFDSPSVFGRLLGDAGGHWSIRPAAAFRATRRYLDKTMVLETTFSTGTGSVTLTDALAMGASERGHDLGGGAPGLLLRQLTGLRGQVELEIEYVPRTEYGLIWPLLSVADGGLAGHGGADITMLSAPVSLPPRDDGTAVGRCTIGRGERLSFGLHYGHPGGPAPRIWTPDDLASRLAGTVAAWQSWSDLHQGYQGPWQDLVHGSGRVLQALTFYPTGAVVAAPTTSLPEQPGGSRNWDYRYSWVRDASLTMEALWVAACPDEARKFLSFLSTAAATSVSLGSDLQIMFGVGGERDLSERTLPQLPGWRGSAPVRVGNGAWTQRQIDVYGELLAAVHRLRRQVGELDPATRAFLVAVADTAARRWTDTDQGIWEVRGPARHFLSAKLMCWVALDRAIALSGQLHAAGRVADWSRTREEIRAAILTRGWSDKAGAFTQSFGSDALDASALMMPIMGFLPAGEERMLATIEAIGDRLTDARGLVYRYDTRTGTDGLAGSEGTFVLCTFWLAQALAMAGRPRQAREVFEHATSYCNDLGLLAEEVDPGTGELLGNFPQAFSHIGLVNAAWAISEAERAR